MGDETSNYEFSNDQVKALFEMRSGLSEVVDRLVIDTREIGTVVSRGAEMSTGNAEFGRCADLNTRPNPNSKIEFNLGHEDSNRPDVDKVFHPTALATVVAVENNIPASDDKIILPIIYRGEDGQAKIVTAKVSASEFERLEAQATAWRKEHPKEEAPEAPKVEEEIPKIGDGTEYLFNPKPGVAEKLSRLRHTERVEPNQGELEIESGQRTIIGSRPHEAPVNGQVDGCIWIEKSDIPEAAMALTLDDRGNVLAEALPGAKVYVIGGGTKGNVEMLRGKTTIPERDASNTHFAIEQKNSELVMLRWGGGSRTTETGRTIKYRTEETDMSAIRGWAIK